MAELAYWVALVMLVTRLGVLLLMFGAVAKPGCPEGAVFMSLALFWEMILVAALVVAGTAS